MINITAEGFDTSGEGFGVLVRPDFSGFVGFANGDVILFSDVRDFIDTAIHTKMALIGQYGDYK
jgi:hypothetical protein